MVQTYSTSHPMSIMVWGAFWDYGKTNLYIMDRDFEFVKHKYSAKSYLEVLNAKMGLAFEHLEPKYQFMQDNASIHTAYKTKD
jgi:hypothetical protein